MASSAPAGSVHTVFSAECNPMFDWHSVALFHSHRTSGQPGGITRLLACDKEALASYRGLDIGPTFVHPNLRHWAGHNYAALNKPGSVKAWLESGEVPESVEYVLFIDADMLINRPLIPAEVGARRGTVVSVPYNYLVGTAQGLADLFNVSNQHMMARCGGAAPPRTRRGPAALHLTPRAGGRHAPLPPR